MTGVISAYQDGFVSEHLPARGDWPELRSHGVVLDYPAQLNVAVELLETALARGWGERAALLTPATSTRPATSISYQALNAWVDEIAHVLRDELHLIPGNRVLLRGWNTPTLVACWLAVLKAGGVVVTSMPLLRAHELGQMLDKAQIRLALCEESLQEELQRALLQPDARGQARRLCWLPFHSAACQGLEAHLAARRKARLPGVTAAAFPSVRTCASDAALIAFTSGTTGQPKAAMHDHRSVLAICDLFPQSILGVQPDDVFCTTSPMGFTYGLGALLCFPLRHGAASLLLAHPAPGQLLEMMAQARISICFSVPTFWRQMALEAAQHDLTSLRCAVSAGEPLPQATRDAWCAAAGVPLIDGLGSTEMLHIFISHRRDACRPGAVGQAIPGYQLAILDEQGQPLSAGQTGRLAVRGPTGCRYLDDERQTLYVRQGWNLTGDLGYLDDAGYFHYLSRSDDMIVSSGYNIAAVEVEEALSLHEAVQECAVIGVPDSVRGQRVQAFVVLMPGHLATAALATELQDFVKAQIAPYKYPRRVHFVGGLPRTETGKLQRYKLLQALAADVELS